MFYQGAKRQFDKNKNKKLQLIARVNFEKYLETSYILSSFELL